MTTKKLGQMVRVMKNGTPTWVAPWYGKLSAAARAAIGGNNIMAPYTLQVRAKLTVVPYEYRYADGSLADPDPRVRQEERDRAKAIAAYPFTKAANDAAIQMAAE